MGRYSRDDTINCSNLTSGNRRIRLFADAVSVRWKDVRLRMARRVLYQRAYLSALLTFLRGQAGARARHHVEFRVEIFHLGLGQSSYVIGGNGSVPPYSAPRDSLLAARIIRRVSYDLDILSSCLVSRRSDSPSVFRELVPRSSVPFRSTPARYDERDWRHCINFRSSNDLDPNELRVAFGNLAPRPRDRAATSCPSFSLAHAPEEHEERHKVCSRRIPGRFSRPPQQPPEATRPF